MSGAAPGQAALKLAFENWFGSTGYDEQGRFDMDEMEFAFEAGAEAARDLTAAAAAQPAPIATLNGEPVTPFTITIETGEAQPAPGRERAKLRTRIAELAKALTEAASHVEPVDQNSELAIGEWLELAKRETAETRQFEQPAPELAALRDLLGEIGVLAANAPEDGDCFAVCEEIAMRIAAHGIPLEGN